MKLDTGILKFNSDQELLKTALQIF
jgi:hypothetical protein